MLDRLKDYAAKSETWILLLCLVGGLLQRGFLLYQFPDLWFCSDEATLGLTALQLLQQGELYSFIPAESAGGSFGVVAIAGIAFLTNSPFVALKIWALTIFLAFTITLFAVGRRLFGRAEALVAVSLVSFAPPVLTILGIRYRDPQAESLFCGMLLLLATIRICSMDRPSSRQYIGWGLLAGLSWWVSYLSVFYILPFLIYILLRRLQYAGLSKGNAGELARQFLGIALGAFAGSIGYWVYVLKNQLLPPFFTNTSSLDPVLGLRDFVLVGLPVIVGGRWSPSPEEIHSMLPKLQLVLYGIALLAFVISIASRKSLRDERLVLLIFLCLYPLVFSFCSFGSMGTPTRYMSGLYLSLPLVLAWFICKTAHHSRTLAILLVLIVTGSSAYGSLTIPPHVFNAAYAEPTRAILQLMEEKSIRHFHADYWIANRLMFESVPSTLDPPGMIGATLPGTGPDRFPDLARAVKDDPQAAYVGWTTEEFQIEELIREKGLELRKQTVGRFTLYHGLE